MAKNYYYMDLSKGEFTTNDKFKMFLRILSCSEELREHVLSCEEDKKECKICEKIKLFIYIFLEFEKTENKEIDIEKIMDKEMVDDSFLSDKFVKILLKF